MNKALVPFASGVLFAVGLVLSGMTVPKKIIDFLDVTGNWDPSLAFVMMGAVSVYATAYWSSRRRVRPVFEESFATVANTRIDARLLVGAALFGVGWGLSGYCPGPALVSSVTFASHTLAFCAAMLVSAWLTKRFTSS